VLRHELLEGLHELLQPRTYLEIGVQTGRSLRFSRSCTIGVDPAFSIVNEVLCDLHLVRATSDEFFAREHPLAHFPFPAADLAFIDGMHLSEYALRDLINVERYTLPTSVIVLDDMLPRHVDEAGRGREAARRRGAWAGDVYKVVTTVRELRPDVVCLEVDTKPTGTVVLLLPDASSTVLSSAYDGLVEEYVVADPQKVPDEVLRRTRAISPRELLDSPIWPTVRRLRELDESRARKEMRETLADAGLRTPS
jgi:hypothetical protein